MNNYEEWFEYNIKAGDKIGAIRLDHEGKLKLFEFTVTRTRKTKNGSKVYSKYNDRTISWYWQDIDSNQFAVEEFGGHYLIQPFILTERTRKIAEDLISGPGLGNGFFPGLYYGF